MSNCESVTLKPKKELGESAKRKCASLCTKDYEEVLKWNSISSLYKHAYSWI